MDFSQNASKTYTPNNNKGGNSLPTGQVPNGDLAISPTSAGILGGAGAEPTQNDIQGLCQVWAEVGRTILLRRKMPDAQ